MRSVVVVLPASMWAMMPMFLHRSNGTVLDTAFFLSSFLNSCSLATEPVKSLISLCFLRRSSLRPANSENQFSVLRSQLPPVVGEGLVGFGHAVNIFFLLDGSAAIVGGVEQFIA